LQRAGLTTSLREIYYRTKHTMKGSHENTFDNQNESDPLVEDLEVALAALREELHVRAENAGSIVGPVVLADDGDRVACARLGKGGYSVPSIVEPEYIEILRCTADFVLLVEKGTQWNRLSEDKFWRRYNCVLLTGNGQPPRGVRRLARRLHEEYKLPVYVLVDNDPWGYYIYSVVKQGSINLAFESERMAIPKFIGLSSADPDSYGLPRNVGIKLNDKDTGRAKELLKYRWFRKKGWQEPTCPESSKRKTGWVSASYSASPLEDCVPRRRAGRHVTLTGENRELDRRRQLPPVRGTGQRFSLTSERFVLSSP
jgi:DNA topoisomerase-6 subunit A